MSVTAAVLNEKTRPKPADVEAWNNVNAERNIPELMQTFSKRLLTAFLNELESHQTNKTAKYWKWSSPLLSCSYSFWSCKTRADSRSDAFRNQTWTVFASAFNLLNVMHFWGTLNIQWKQWSIVLFRIIISLCTHSINRKVNTFQSEIKLLVLIQDHVNKCYIRAETFNTDTIETKACKKTTFQRQPDTFSKTFLLWRTNESICPHRNCGFTDPENSCVCVCVCVCVCARVVFPDPAAARLYPTQLTVLF